MKRGSGNTGGQTWNQRNTHGVKQKPVLPGGTQSLMS